MVHLRGRSMSQTFLAVVLLEAHTGSVVVLLLVLLTADRLVSERFVVAKPGVQSLATMC
jgi:hypothetical protein